MQWFVLTDDIHTLHGEDAWVVGVPQELADKNALLHWYAETLEPPYFGYNWDAFDEILRDLSWLKQRRLVLYHRGMPLEGNPKDQAIYVDVLARAVRDWKPGEAHEVIVAFHPSCELKLHALKRR